MREATEGQNAGIARLSTTRHKETMGPGQEGERAVQTLAQIGGRRQKTSVVATGP